MVEIRCDNCKKIFKIHKCYLKRKRKNRFCSKKCEGEYKNYNNTIDNWKGGYISKSTGYKYVMLNGKQIEEHRLVMMKHLGRELATCEVVHHKNGNKLDNRIDNLELLTSSEHIRGHNKNRKTKNKCIICGEKYYARSLCKTCYMKAYKKGELYKYAIS